MSPLSPFAPVQCIFCPGFGGFDKDVGTKVHPVHTLEILTLVSAVNSGSAMCLQLLFLPPKRAAKNDPFTRAVCSGPHLK